MIEDNDEMLGLKDDDDGDEDTSGDDDDDDGMDGGIDGTVVVGQHDRSMIGDEE